MKNLSITACCRLLLTAGLMLLALSAAAMELRISTLFPDGTAEVRALREASAEISERTEGRVSLRLFPGGAMGDDQAVDRRIRTGQLHGSLVQTGAIAPRYRDIQILNAPFLFDDYDEVSHVRAALEPDLIEGLRAQGMHSFGFIDGGFAYVMGRQPVRTVEDLQRRRLWLPANDNFSLQVARSFGVSPIVLNISDVLTSLQTGAIDTIIAPPAAALTLQWFTRVDTITDTPLIYTFALVYIDDRYFSRLSPDDQAVVTEVLTRTSHTLDERNRSNNHNAFEALLNQGLERIELTSDERAAIRDKAEQANRVLVREGEFSAQWLDRLLAALEDYRQGQP